MARVLHPNEGEELRRPGRRPREFVSHRLGASRATLRRVDIPPQPQGAATGPPRPMHRHLGLEEVIVVWEGHAELDTPSGRLEGTGGDVFHVPAGEWHRTFNVGEKSLVLLCFFPDGDVDAVTEEPGVGKAGR